MKLSAAVMAHPERESAVAALLGRLDRPVPVAWDDEGPASGSADRVWRTARKAWQLAEVDADWHVIVQDDALPCPDMLAGLERALDHVPAGAIVSGYLGTGRNVAGRWRALAGRAEYANASWLRSDRLVWGVCIAIPRWLLPQMIEWADMRSHSPDDARVAGWAQARQLEVWYTWPSLVDHLPLPSLTKHRLPDRVAASHLGSRSALDVDWAGPVVLDPMTTRLRARSGPRRRD